MVDTTLQIGKVLRNKIPFTIMHKISCLHRNVKALARFSNVPKILTLHDCQVNPTNISGLGCFGKSRRKEIRRTRTYPHQNRAVASCL